MQHAGKSSNDDKFDVVLDEPFKQVSKPDCWRWGHGVPIEQG